MIKYYILAVFGVLILLLVNKFLNIIRENFRRSNNLSTIKSGEDIIELLDKRIDENLNIYVILNLKYKDSLYISGELQDEIEEDIYRDTIAGLSSNFIDELSVLFDRNVLSEIIKIRVQLAVMAYVIENNGNYKE